MNISNDKKSFYQWETNRFLVDEDFKINQEVCFSSVKLRKALVVKTKLKNNKIVVEVPNLLLQDYHPIMVHWVIADENGKYVTKEQEFQVLKRAKPEDYVYTETEIFSFLDLEQRLKNLEEEGINKAIADYFVKNPIQSGATSEQAAQIIQNKENIEKLNKNKLDADKLPEAINNALTQAEASGAFKGEPGKDGVVPVTGAAVGQTVKITAVDENGNPTEWEATDFPESSTQTDWNQNDESAVDYIKNRPFYDGIEDVLVSEVEVTEVRTTNPALSNPDENGKRKEFYEAADDIKLSSAKYICGEEYIIDINGEQYISRFSCVSDAEYFGVYAVGFNIDSVYMSSVRPNIDSEFCLVGSYYISELLLDGEECDTDLSCYLSSDIALPATIKIKHREKVLKQLDPKYLKDMYYTETVQKSETREFVGGKITDAEFAALLYENRQTAVFTHPSGRTFAYLEDNSSDENYWFVKTDIEGAPPLQVRVLGDTVGARDFTSVTVNYEVEKVHQLDSKYIKDMYHETSIEEVVIEEDVEMTAGMNSCEGSFSVNINVVPNDTYTLYVNGTLYGTATTAEGHLMFGSGYNSWQINDGGRVYTFYDGGVYTLKLVHNTSELKQLDEKYIPDSIARVEDVEALHSLVGDTPVAEQVNNALNESAVLYSAAQELTEEQKQQAQDNIGFSETDAIELATNMGLISPVAAEDGSIYTDENGALYSL